jgi:hypothetical protein
MSKRADKELLADIKEAVLSIKDYTTRVAEYSLAA